tara:strand:+ start:1703 stop:3055 length:1353 start_codon:yes stop_codon:yes gene_type:complete
MNKIESKSQLISNLSIGEKNSTDYRIGTEHEKFVFNLQSKKPIHYDEENGISSLLTKLEDFGWEPINEDDRVIALSRKNANGGGSITLEPAGQFELSGEMFVSVHETYNELVEHKAQISKIGKTMGIDFLALGFAANWSREDMPVMPKSRYEVMRNYMPKVGNHGLDMMLRSSTAQVNLDFSSEKDMINKLKLSFLLQPVATALFANSPFSDGSLNGYKSIRSEYWKDTDPDRTGILTFVFDNSMSYERYVDYALDVPMYFINRKGKYIDLAGKSFRDFMMKKIDAVRNYDASIDDWELHLTTIFPEARLKNYIEMRGADAGNIDHICALSAFWVGLIYDTKALDEALELTKGITKDELVELRNKVPLEGLDCSVGKHDVYKLASEAIDISKSGLKRRNKLNTENNDESIYLKYLEEIIIRKESPADKLARKFNSDWNKNIEKVFENCLF